jgi:hypothetical protein
MRIVLIAVVVVVLGAVGALLFVLSSLDDLIQEAVQTYGSEITQAKVSLAEVDIDLTSGRGSLRGLSIGNPAGFDTPSAFELGAISITIDTGTVTDDTIVITEIVIEAPVITYELGANGSNIDAIQRNVEAYMARFGGGGTATDDDDGEGPKLIIDDLYIRGGEIKVSAGFLAGKTLGTALPDIHLEDIGRSDGGASPAEIAEQIISAITDGTTSAISGLGLEQMMGDAGEMIEGIAEGAGELLESVTGGDGVGLAGVTAGAGEAVEGMVEDAGEALEGIAEGATKALGNLFGGSND